MPLFFMFYIWKLVKFYTFLILIINLFILKLSISINLLLRDAWGFFWGGVKINRCTI